MRSNGLVLALSLSLAVPAGTRAGGQSPAQTAAGASLPDAVTLAMHAALEQVLRDKAAQIQGPAQDPTGAPFGDAIKMGLVLIKETTIEQFQQAQQQLAALRTAAPSVREAELAKIRDLAIEARDAYREMRAIERDELKGDMSGEARGLYESTARDAEAAEKAGRTAEGAALRKRAAESRWGRYLAARQRFYTALGAHPLLGVRLPGGVGDLFLDQAYFFNRVLESAVPRRGTGVSVATLLQDMDDHISEAISQLHDQQTRIEKMMTWKDLWQLGSSAFDSTQTQAAGVGGDLSKGLVDAVTATHKGATAVSAADNLASDTLWSMAQVASMIVPVVGPLVSAGITGMQIYKSGDEFVIALGDLKNAEQGATVTGYQTVIEAKDRVGEAGGKLVVNIAMAPAEIPGLVEALKAGKVLVKRGVTFARDAKGVLTGTEDAAKAARAAEDAKAGAAAASKAATGRGGSVLDRAERGAQKARDLGLPASEIKKIDGYLERARTAARTGEGGLLTTAATKQLVQLDDIEVLIAEARLAGVPEQDLQAMLDRARKTATLEGYVGGLVEDLFAAKANREGRIFIVDKSAIDRFKEFFGEGVLKPKNVIVTDAVTLESVRSNLTFMKNGRTVTWTPQELDVLQKLMRGAGGDPLKMVRFVSDEKTFVKIFTQEDLDFARKFITSPDAAKIATGSAVLGDLAPAALVNASGDLISAEQAARLSTGELGQIPFDFVRQMDPRNPLTRALAERFADAGDATAKAWARDVLATADTARAAAATPTRSSGTAKAPPVPPRPPAGTNASSSAPSKPTGGLTAEDEKRASDAMLKEGVGMAPKTATGGFICGTDNCGVLTIDPNNLIHLTLPGGVTTYPGVITPGGLELFPPGTAVSPDAPPSTPTYVSPPFPLPLGFKDVTMNGDGSVTYRGVPINGLSRTPTGDWSLAPPTDRRPAPDPIEAWAITPRPNDILSYPGGLTFTPPAKDKTGPTSGGDSGGGNTVGGNGLPYAPPVPPGPLFGWGEAEWTTDNPPDPEPRAAPAPDPGLVEIGRLNGDPRSCCVPGVQSEMMDLGSPMDVEPTRAPVADMNAVPQWPWSMRSVASAVRSLLAGVTSAASARALDLANLPVALPPSLTARAAFAPSGGAATGAPQLKTFIRSLGTSQGDAFDLQIVNEGLSAVHVRGSGVVVEPVKREVQEQMQKEMAKLVRGSVATRRVEAYCLAFGLKPPTPGMLFQIAAPDIQAKFAPARAVLGAGQKLSAAGLLHPDSAVKSYVESIKQYAIWTRIENWDMKHFAETWVEKTKANAAAAKQNWTKEMETALMSAVAGRWRDIQAILQEAQAHTAGGQ